jgi:hypothetical protein
VPSEIELAVLDTVQEREPFRRGVGQDRPVGILRVADRRVSAAAICALTQPTMAVFRMLIAALIVIVLLVAVLVSRPADANRSPAPAPTSTHSHAVE